MNRAAQEKNYQSQDSVYQTPVKKTKTTPQDPQTRQRTYQNFQKNNYDYHDAIHHSNTSNNIFKRRRNYKKVIKQANLHYLTQQRSKLEDLKQTILKFNQESVTDKYLNELDKMYVICARIKKIQLKSRLYTIFVQDQKCNQFKFYVWKNNLEENNHIKKKILPLNRIINIDQLAFESSQFYGQPYFRFFVYFRELSLFDKQEQNFLNSQNPQNYRQQSIRKVNGQKPTRTQFRSNIQHFEKMQNFNQLVWHNTKVMLNYWNQHLQKKEKKQQSKNG